MLLGQQDVRSELHYLGCSARVVLVLTASDPITAFSGVSGEHGRKRVPCPIRSCGWRVGARRERLARGVRAARLPGVVELRRAAVGV